MYQVIWKYKIEEKNQNLFEAAYGQYGVWATFFHAAKEYRGSQLLRATDSDTSYLLIDQWSTKEDYEKFLDQNHLEYQQMSTDFGKLYIAEERLGTYQTVQ